MGKGYRDLRLRLDDRRHLTDRGGAIVDFQEAAEAASRIR